MADIPSKVFPLPGWSGPIQNHWGQAIGGSDLMVTPGSSQPVVSMTTGKVVFVSSQKTAANSGGNAVEIQGIDGLYYYYAHLKDAIGLKPGDTVKVGQQLGIADSSGNASANGPHLHVGIGHSISQGVGALGGLGVGYDAVSLLKSLQKTANIPSLGTAQGQASVGSNQPAGTIKIGIPPPPAAGDSIIARIRYLAALLAAAGVDPTKIPTLVAISLAENRGSDPKAISSTNDYGLWQINWPTWGQTLCRSNLQICTPEQLMDPAKNAAAAAYVLVEQGFTAWSTYKVGAQKQFQSQVDSALSGIDLGSGGDNQSGNDDGSTDPAADCPKWTLLDTTIVGSRVKFEIPDLGCVLLTNLQQLIGTSIAEFKQFVWEKTYDWGFNLLFALVGLVFIFIAGAAIAKDNPGLMAAAAMA